jgi:hypothetical protein
MVGAVAFTHASKYSNNFAKKGLTSSTPSSSTYNIKQQISQQTNFRHSLIETNEVLNELTDA